MNAAFPTIGPQTLTSKSSEKKGGFIVHPFWVIKDWGTMAVYKNA